MKALVQNPTESGADNDNEPVVLVVVDLAVVVLEVAAELHQRLPQAAQLAVDIQMTTQPIRGDAARLARLVRELVVSAARESPYGGEVLVRVRRTNAQATLLEVCDTRGHRTSLQDLGIACDVAREHRAAIKIVDCELTGSRTTIIFPAEAT